MKKFLLSMATILTVALAGFCVTSCGDDDDNGGGNNEIVNRIVGKWQSGSEILILNADYTGSYSGNPSRAGSFTFGNPYDIEEEKGTTYFLIDIKYTSGDNKGKEKDFELGYTKDNTSILYVEGKSFTKVSK